MAEYEILMDIAKGLDVLKPGDEFPAEDYEPREIAALIEAGALAGEVPEDDWSYDDHTVPELRAELENRGLDTRGPKAALIARLQENDEEEEPEE